ncbi:MAG: hypothetical protein IKI77_03330 [Oscillospiraceae bacterium]|nr:hypothetical protein [Oscillospiraceae bacterium]
MKSIQKIVSAAAAAAAVLAVVPVSAFAADEPVYGTMNIPYAEFYAAELGENAYAVDAVTSATKAKALKNGEGELFEGSYNNGEDTILGVTYPVAISQADLDALGDNNYGFQKLDSAPAAYKNVTVADGKAAFSAVQDSAPETLDAQVQLSTSTAWGDYLIDLKGTPEDWDIHYRGAILKTADGKAYAMRHEENLWRGEIAWSSGIKKEEPHGNQLRYENYTGLMGSTVKEILLITKNGIVTVATDTYIPVKFEGEIKADDAAAGTGKTALDTSALPADYEKTYTLDGFTVSDSEISYTDAKPGVYTLNVSDGKKKYADLSASFTLSTDDVPVKYEDGKLVPADGFTADDAANFIKNLSAVEVGENKFSASGRGAVKVFDENGALNFDAESRNGKVFPEGADGTYAVKVSAAGYNKPLEISLAGQAAAADTTASATNTAASTTTTTTKASSSSTSKATSKASTTAAKTSSVKTGDAGIGAAFALLTAAGAAAFIAKKKED